MTNIPAESSIPDKITKFQLVGHLEEFGVNTDGEKKTLQFRSTIAELGLPEAPQEKENQQVEWFLLQKSQLKEVCSKQQVATEGTIPEMRRALVWNMCQENVDIEAPKPTKRIRKQLRTSANTKKMDIDSAPPPKQHTKAELLKIQQLVTQLLLQFTDDSGESTSEPEPEPAPKPKPTQRTKTLGKVPKDAISSLQLQEMLDNLPKAPKKKN